MVVDRSLFYVPHKKGIDLPSQVKNWDALEVYLNSGDSTGDIDLEDPYQLLNPAIEFYEDTDATSPAFDVYAQLVAGIVTVNLASTIAASGIQKPVLPVGMRPDIGRVRFQVPMYNSSASPSGESFHLSIDSSGQMFIDGLPPAWTNTHQVLCCVTYCAEARGV